MAHTTPDIKDFRYNWAEFSGSLGDLGLFLPIVVAMTLAVGVDIGVVLVTAGAMNVATGFIFKQPIPVQPMKAIAVVAITEGMLREELMAAGFVMGLLLLILSVSGTVDRIARHIPISIVRGIQLGVGAKLAIKGLSMIAELPLSGWDSMLSAVIVCALLVFMIWARLPGLLPVFMAGFLIIFFTQPEVYSSFRFVFPRFQFLVPDLPAWTNGLLMGSIPQLPLTMLNSVVAVSALSERYFPKQGLAPTRVAFSVGVMNLLCVPIGGIPMCHGAGGLAAQHRFGARTGGSVIMLGVLKILVGLLFGSALLGVLQAYPDAILGSMLVLAGVELAKAAKDVIGSVALIVTAATALVIIFVNTVAGFFVGVLAVGLISVLGGGGKLKEE